MHWFRLHTEGYTFEENALIVAWFNEVYGVRATINTVHKALKDGSPRTYFCVRIGHEEFKKIACRVEPYIIPSMRYKIGFSQDKGQLSRDGELKTRSGLTGDRESQPEMVGRPG